MNRSNVTKTPRSRWIAATAYRASGNGTGTVAIRTRRGDTMIYSAVPSWAYALVHAHPSPGRAFGLLIRNRYPYTHVAAEAA